MTFKTTVNTEGQIRLGDDAIRAGFTPGQLVEIIRSKATGTLIIVIDDTPVMDAPYHMAPPEAQRAIASPEPRRVLVDEPAPAEPPRTCQPSTEKRMRIGATRIGIPLAEYRKHVEAGERWCSPCQRWQPQDEMVRRAARPDGFDNVCKAYALRRTEDWQRRRLISGVAS